MTPVPSEPAPQRVEPVAPNGSHRAPATPGGPDRPTRRADPWRLLLGVTAVLVAAVTAGCQLAGWNGVPMTPTQWLFGLGGLCVVLGGAGLLLRRRD